MDERSQFTNSEAIPTVNLHSNPSIPAPSRVLQVIPSERYQVTSYSKDTP